MTKTTPTAFDFGSRDLGAVTDKPFEFEIKDPQTEEGVGVFISVVGAESETFQNYVREESNKIRLEAFRKKRLGKSAEEMVPIEREEDAILNAIAHCIKGWRTVIDGTSEPVIWIAGERLEFSQANAQAWLKKFRWVRQQVNDATADLSNFIPA